MDKLLELFINFFGRSKRGSMFIGVVLIVVALFAVWNSFPDEKKIKYLNAFESVFTNKGIAHIQIGPFKISDNTNDQSIWLKTKIERKLVEYYIEKSITVFHPLKVDQSLDCSNYTIRGEIHANPDGKTSLSVDVTNYKGLAVSSISFDESSQFYKMIYRELPETIWYSMGIDPISFKSIDSRLSTTSPSAYAYYLSAKRSVTSNEIDEAQHKLHLALRADSNFAMAYWALGEINRISGQSDKAEEYYSKAIKIDPDHPKHPISNKVPVPLPSFLRELQKNKWEKVNTGLDIKSVRIEDYSSNLVAVKFSTDLFAIQIASQRESTGNDVKDFLKASNGAILAVNGGFFEVDQNDRLSPSGTLIINRQEKAAYHKRAGSGFLYDTATTIGIDWSKNARNITDAIFGLQSGPLVVDPGGKNGIYVDDHDQRRRSAFCLNGNTATVIVVDGGLSLYEFGELLSTKEKHGGFSCERAINLDGGPSSQLYFDYKGRQLDVKGTWKVNNAILVVPRKH